MSGSENDVVFARLKALQDIIKGLKPGKSDATIVAVVQELLGFLIACFSQEVINVTIKVLEDGIVLSPQAGTILRLEGGLKQVVKHLKAASALPAVAGPCARILAVAAATSTVTQQALAKEKGLGLVLVNTCALHMRDPTIAGPVCEVMAHISRTSKGASQLECDSLLPVMQELLVSYLGNWPVFGWVLKLLKNLAKHEYTQNGSGAVVGTGIPASRGGSGLLTTGGEAVRMLLGVARVLARIPEQRKLLKRVSRTLWLLCPHVLLPMPPLEPLVPLPAKDSPHLMVPGAGESDAQRHQELFPEEYAWQQLPPPQLLPPSNLAQPQASCWPGNQSFGPSLTVRPNGALPARPPSARQVCRSISGPGFGGASDLGVGLCTGLGQIADPFHGYGSSLDCDMMLHDLQRIANPRSLLNRIVYMNNSTGGAGAGGAGTGTGSVFASLAGNGFREAPPPGRGGAMSPEPVCGSWSDSASRAPFEGGRAASGILPDLNRLGIADTVPMDSTSSSIPGTSASGGRTASPPDVDPFFLPLIGADPWGRGEAAGSSVGANPGAGGSGGGGGGNGSGPPGSVQRNSGRFGSQITSGGLGGGPAGAGGAGGTNSPRPPSPPAPPLTFHSCFESGNLRCAAQVGPREYDLFLAADLNDRSEGGNLCQWFYFAVTVPPGACSGAGWPLSGRNSVGSRSNGAPSLSQATAEGQAAGSDGGGGGGGGAAAGASPSTGLGQGPGIKMNIANLRKKESLFSGGKRPVICLARPAAEGEAGGGMGGPGGGASTTPRSRPGSAPTPVTDPGVWFRAGSHISYYPSPYRGRPTVAGEGAASRKGKKPSVASIASAATTGGSGAPGGPGTAPYASGSSASPARKGKTKGKAAAAADADGDGAGGALGAIGPGLYCATFTLHFPVPGTYYVASCYPYTYSDLQDYLDNLQRRLAAGLSPGAGAGSRPTLQLASPPLMVRSLLCYSLGGLRSDLLTITDWSSPLEVVRQRECIFITARVHPGETCASWLMQGILDFLCSSDPAAVTLRSSFVFKLVPMLNPDGVVNGNYRCSLAGVDLNRVWDRPVRFLYPTVYHAKRVLQQMAAAGRLALYIDVHGHSTKSDTFFYGCEPSAAALQAHSGGGGKAPAAASTTSLPYNPNPRASALGNPGMGAPPDGDCASQLLSQQLQHQAAAMQGGGYYGIASGPGGLAGMGSTGAPLVGSSLSMLGGNPVGNGGYGPGGAGGGSMYGGGPMGQSVQMQFQGGQGSSQPPPPAAANGPSARVAARLRVRMLPYLTARISSDFSYPKCSFKIRKAKLSAARVVVHRELGVAGSYTLEASLAGSSTSATHFSARDYLAMGHNLCRAICELAEVDDAALLEEMNARLTLPPL